MLGKMSSFMILSIFIDAGLVIIPKSEHLSKFRKRPPSAVTVKFIDLLVETGVLITLSNVFLLCMWFIESGDHPT
jgi:hypothetical protein